jgi:FdhD protein
LATEEPLEIRVGWPTTAARRFTVTMRTPGHDFELAVGLLHGEGLLDHIDAVERVTYCTEQELSADQAYNVVTVDLHSAPRRWPERALAATSACGVCGAQSLDDVAEVAAGGPVPSAMTVGPDLVRALPDRLRQHQRVFDSTGGLHAAGAFSAGGEARVVREDIGRHNAVDKVVGQAVMERRRLTDAVLCVSGRVGFEIVQKAAVATVPVLVAVGAPSSLAVALASRAGITVVGFVRGDRMVAYSHPQRLV